MKKDKHSTIGVYHSLGTITKPIEEIEIPSSYPNGMYHLFHLQWLANSIFKQNFARKMKGFLFANLIGLFLVFSSCNSDDLEPRIVHVDEFRVLLIGSPLGSKQCGWTVEFSNQEGGLTMYKLLDIPNSLKSTSGSRRYNGKFEILPYTHHCQDGRFDPGVGGGFPVAKLPLVKLLEWEEVK